MITKKDITRGSVVGFTSEGLSIVAVKKTSQGVKIFRCYLSDPVNPYRDRMLFSETNKQFPNIELLVDYINSIYDDEKTAELAWW